MRRPFKKETNVVEYTPMMKQYRKIKEDHSDCILFFRLGDFYEMFEDDARTASKELDLTLTTRDRAKEDPDERVPMCGVPYHSSEAYISRLIAKGYKVAICEQMEDPKTAKGLVDRDVIRIVTPGTVIDPSMLEDGKSNYLASVYLDTGGAAVCFADISTGEICARSFSASEKPRVLNELARFSPSEAVINCAAAEDSGIRAMLDNKLSCLVETQDERFDYMQSTILICQQFSVLSLDELGLGAESQAVSAVGALLSYINDTQKTDMSHINKLDLYSDGKYMELDIQTIRNLELLYSLRAQEKKGSLLWALDKTKTPMGTRLIRSWVSRPLLSPAAINRRLSAVEELYNDNVSRPELMIAMRGIGDMERIIGKVVYGTVSPRDLNSLALGISKLPDVLALIAPMNSSLMTEIKSMDRLDDIRAMINNAICDEAPFTIRDGGIFREGFNAEIDRLRSLLGGSQQALADIEAREKARTGKKLKVGYNKVFGYYIEIPRAQSADVPEDYIRKQTLVNGERFITEELKNLETELLTAKDRLAELEFELFTNLRQEIASHVLRVQATAALVAELDVLCSFADVAVAGGWCRPEITVDGVIDIKDGRHPVVELMQKDTLFVPNDTYLDCAGASTSIITGPNMAGKSTYMRQTALIVLMAQMGSFVPARSASISIVDRVFTRIGASDDLSAGKSTFMVEMSEVAEILKNATNRSLLILDEIGRGTSTYDGMSIARAVVEYCADKKKLGAKTMFATHYHELTALEDTIPGVKNYNISAKKRGGDIIFLRKIIPGGADDSYGIEVAQLAGVPDNIIKRAKVILAELSSEGAAPAPSHKAADTEEQFSLETMSESEVSQILKKTDINTITPLEAMNLLYELKKKVSQ
jgi:DNA mismatch repair protein MutS